MISGAEQRRIGRALESVAGWTTEMIVVLNTEVADETEAIARKYGAKVFREPWKGHVAQKNSAALKATQPWRLGLDADEVVSPDLRAEIESLFSTKRCREHEAWSFPRCTWYCGRWIRHGDWYPDRQTRLWQGGKASWGGVDPHDRLEVMGSTGKLNADLWHYSNQSIAQQIAKIVPYQEQIVRRRVEAGKSAGFWELAFRPWWRFMRAYVFRLGFLDGWQGFYIAGLSAFSTLTRYALVRESGDQKPEPPG